MPTEPLYVALGDSTAVGVGAESGGGYPDRLVCKLRAAYPALKLLNLGQSGATNSDVLESQVPRALRTRPRLITLGIGINARPELFSPDGFHPSALGYDVWAGRMLAPAVALLRESIGASA